MRWVNNNNNNIVKWWNQLTHIIQSLVRSIVVHAQGRDGVDGDGEYAELEAFAEPPAALRRAAGVVDLPDGNDHWEVDFTRPRKVRHLTAAIAIQRKPCYSYF